MSKTRKQYDREFKVMAVELSRSRENMANLAQELGVRAELLYRWMREFTASAETSFSGNGKTVRTF